MQAQGHVQRPCFRFQWSRRPTLASLGAASAQVAVTATACATTAFRVHRVKGDGNCMFGALAQAHHFKTHHKLMDDGAESVAAAALRTSIVEQMNMQRNVLEFFITEPWHSYIAKMQRQGVWGGEVELAAAAGVLQSAVHVYGPGKGGETFKLISMYGEQYGGEPASVLFYGQHYDALIPRVNIVPEP